jgi:hypothetical protein
MGFAAPIHPRAARIQEAKGEVAVPGFSLGSSVEGQTPSLRRRSPYI